MDELQRFEKYTVKSKGGCWQWIGYKIHNGYGRIRYQKRMTLAHRVSYELFRGEIPDGLSIDHLCRNRLCVNPEHLEVVDHITNVLRGFGPTAMNARKTHCIRGHKLPSREESKQRQCSICAKNTRTKSYRRLKKSGPSNPISHCNKGHAFTAENTLLHGGSQHCRICAKLRMDKFRANHQG